MYSSRLIISVFKENELREYEKSKKEKKSNPNVAKKPQPCIRCLKTNHTTDKCQCKSEERFSFTKTLLVILAIISYSYISRHFESKYRCELKGLHVLLSRTQAGPGNAVRQEQEENSCYCVQAF